MADACVTCKKTAPEITIKRCAKCTLTPYCSRDCQKADWKSHRKICGKQSGGPSFSSPSSSSAANQPSPLKGLEKSILNPFTRIGKGTWLHDRPETDVYRLLIDAYRLRVEDEYTFDGEIYEGSIYTGTGNGLKGFRRFLDCVASRPGLLPPWWNAEKRACCERLGLDPSQWQNLSCAVEKSDIIEHYGVPFFPMELRMFAEKAIGSGVGGQNGTMMLQMMAAREGGDDGRGPNGVSAMIDLNTRRTTIL